MGGAGFGKGIPFLQQANAFVARPEDGIELQQRIAHAGVDRNIVSPAKLEQFVDHACAQVDIAVDGGDADQVNFIRGAEQDAEGEDVVHIGADIGVEDNLVLAGHSGSPWRRDGGTMRAENEVGFTRWRNSFFWQIKTSTDAV